jgi:uncharacterized membrane protein YphA (DoxX/SURF4 family)
LLLRAAVGITVLIQGGFDLAGRANPTLETWIVSVLGIVSASFLLVGLLTPVAAALVCLGTIGIALSWFPAFTPNLFEAKLSVVFAVVMSAAIFFLGPGAFSIDARLFGRHEIIIPPVSHRPQ